jgi:hypothetical protein
VSEQDSSEDNTESPSEQPNVASDPPAAVASPPRRSDANHWYWLLILPIVVPLLPMLYNGTDPTLLGVPRFYWLQLAFVFLGVGTTILVYRMTRTPSNAPSNDDGDGR